MKVSDWVLKRLAQEGITHAFTVYGGAISELMDAFTRQKEIKYVTTIHEQAAGFAAEGYAKAKGVTGLAIATSGPGGGNLVVPIQDCYYDSTPCLFITGQVATPFIHEVGTVRQLGFQETPIVEIVKTITKFASQPRTPKGVVADLETALRMARSGRPGPVLLDIPTDVQKMDMPACFEPKLEKAGRGYDGSGFVDYVKDLNKSKRPAILVGGGARGASLAISTFARQHAIPVFRTWNGLDVIHDDDEAYCGTVGTYGGAGRNFGIQNCDLLLILGCRLSGRITGGMPTTFARGAKKYLVDIDHVGLNPMWQQVKIDVNIEADANEFMFKRTTAESHFQEWFEQCQAWKIKYDPVQAKHFSGKSSEEVKHYGFMRKLSNMMPEDAIIVSDTGGNQIMMGHCWQSKRGQRIFSSNGNTPMGFSMCGAMGAWFAEPERPVICIVGDGGFQMNVQELQTLISHGIKIKVFVINNHVLGNTLSYQRVNGMKEVGCQSPDYQVPDILKVCVAYGIEATHISSWRYVEPVIRIVMETDAPCVCDVPGHDQCTYEPRVSQWNVGIEEAYPPLPEEEQRANMGILKEVA